MNCECRILQTFCLVDSDSSPFYSDQKTHCYSACVVCCVLADGRCGLVSSTPVVKGQDVQIGCHVQYDWLSARLLYRQIVSIDASIEFLGQPETLFVTNIRNIRGFVTVLPYRAVYLSYRENLTTTFTIRNVQAGQIRHTCRVRFEFEKRTYGGRNSYATNPLEWNCAVSGQ